MQKKPVHRAMLLEDALLALVEMEHTALELENSDAFQTLTGKEKARYRDVVSRLRDLDPRSGAGQRTRATGVLRFVY